jgi:LysR family nitrogen assimilation transcriptional regulator
MVAMPLARAIRDRYLGIALELVEAPSAELGSLIGSGRVEFALAVDAVETCGVAAERLLTEALYLIAWPEFPMPSKPVGIADAAHMPLILPSAPNTIRSRVEWALRELGLRCEILFEASSTALLFAAVPLSLCWHDMALLSNAVHKVKGQYLNCSTALESGWSGR